MKIIAKHTHLVRSNTWSCTDLYIKTGDVFDAVDYYEHGLSDMHLYSITINGGVYNVRCDMFTDLQEQRNINIDKILEHDL